MIEHLELMQKSLRRHPTEAEFDSHGRVIRMRNIQCECSVVGGCTEVDRSKFIWLSESFPDLTGPQLEALNEFCLKARYSEEFFLTGNATNQWVRTVIGHENLHPSTWTKAKNRSNFISSIDIHSNILPYDPYWSKLWGTRDGTNTSIHFTSCMLKEALEESKTLKTKLLQWKRAGKGCDIGKHGTGRLQDGDCEPSSLKLFWEIQAGDVKFVQVLASGSCISLVTWRGGRFIRKEGHKEFQTQFDAEIEVVKRFSHPHIVYGFGAQLCDGMQSSYFMEYMSHDLFNFIVDRINRVVGDDEPPFSPHDSVDILSQIAKAMKYMHHENVVHCDLKSVNILLSEIATSDKVKHYLVKVADFGSAQLVDSSSDPVNFVPGDSTTKYAAPEVLVKRRSGETVRINSPHKIDVYSFGIVAFEVLTGKITGVEFFELCKKSPKEFKKRVIEGSVRPPLRTECQKHKEFIHDKDLISLIERCWHADPVERPSFVEICDELDKARVRISEQSNHPKRQATTSPTTAQFHQLLHSFTNYFQGANVHAQETASTSRNPSR